MVQDKVVVTTDVLLIMSASTIAVESTIVRHSKYCTHFKKGCTGFQFSKTGWSRIYILVGAGFGRKLLHLHIIVFVYLTEIII